MQFKFLAIAAAALASVVSGQSGQQPGGQQVSSPEAVVKSIVVVTEISAETAQIVSTWRASTIFSAAPRVVTNFRRIVNAVTSTLVILQDSRGQRQPLGVDSQTLVCQTFRRFVIVHQRLLSLIIGKKSILAGTSFGRPIAAVLRTIEAGVDRLAFALIDMVPTCRATFASDKAALETSFATTFAQLSKTPFQKA